MLGVNRSFALNQRQSIVDKAVIYIVAFGVNPFIRHNALNIGDFGNIHAGERYLVIRAVLALIVHHFTGAAGDSFLYGSLRNGIAFFNIGFGCAVCGAALQQAEFYRTGLNAQLITDNLCQVVCRAA